MPLTLLNGFGGADGARNMYLHSGVDVFYVSSVVGGASNSGRDRTAPFATLQQAVTAASSTDGTTIVLMDGHAEEISTAVTIDFRCWVEGEGTVELTLAAGSNNLLDLDSGSSRSRIKNITFRPPGNAAAPGATTGSYFDSNQDDLDVLGCRIEVDQHSDAPGVAMAATANAWRFSGCTFISVETSTAAADRPREPLSIAGALVKLTLEDCTFDAGVTGFQDASAGDEAALIATDTIVPIQADGIILLNGADIEFVSGTEGCVQVQTVTGSSRVVWPD